jgi:hypothetical protein
MPYIYNFSNILSDLHTVSVNPKGWKTPLFVEYGISQVNKYDPMLSVVWRVKGTTHSFVIPEQRLNVMSNGNYIEHFNKTLVAFREDYLSWFKDEYYSQCEWKKEYEEQYKDYIIK